MISPLSENNMESSSVSVKTEDYTYCYLKLEEKDFKIVSKTEIKGNKHTKYSLDEEDDNDLNTNKKTNNKNINYSQMN